MSTEQRRWLLVPLAGLGLVAAVFILWRAHDRSQPNGHLPRDFPHAFLAPADDGHPERIVLWRGRVPPPTIVDHEQTCYPVWECPNQNCPGRTEAGPWIFAYGPDPAHSICTQCAQRRSTAKTAAERQHWDPPHVQQYFVPEAHAAIDHAVAGLAP